VRHGCGFHICPYYFIPQELAIATEVAGKRQIARNGPVIPPLSPDAMTVYEKCRNLSAA
jgi:hypothetical protein